MDHSTPTQRHAPGGRPAAIDRTALLERFGGDADIFARVVATFLDQYPVQLAAVARAVEASDAHLIATTAHRLKGAVSIFDVEAAVEPAVRLEQMAQSNELGEASEVFARLEREVTRLGVRLREML